MDSAEPASRVEHDCPAPLARDRVLVVLFSTLILCSGSEPAPAVRHACALQGSVSTTTGTRSHSRPRAAHWPEITLQDRKEEGTLISLELLLTGSTLISQPLELAPQHPKCPIPKDMSCSGTHIRAQATQLLAAAPKERSWQKAA